jgi:hypothetical protein
MNFSVTLADTFNSGIYLLGRMATLRATDNLLINIFAHFLVTIPLVLVIAKLTEKTIGVEKGTSISFSLAHIMISVMLLDMYKTEIENLNW